MVNLKGNNTSGASHLPIFMTLNLTIKKLKSWTFPAVGTSSLYISAEIKPNQGKVFPGQTETPNLTMWKFQVVKVAAIGHNPDGACSGSPCQSACLQLPVSLCLWSEHVAQWHMSDTHTSISQGCADRLIYFLTDAQKTHRHMRQAPLVKRVMTGNVPQLLIRAFKNKQMLRFNQTQSGTSLTHRLFNNSCSFVTIAGRRAAVAVVLLHFI